MLCSKFFHVFFVETLHETQRPQLPHGFREKAKGTPRSAAEGETGGFQPRVEFKPFFVAKRCYYFPPENSHGNGKMEVDGR